MLHPTPKEKRLSRAVERGHFGVWDLDPRLELVRYSPPWKARLGFAACDQADSTSFWRSRVHPDDLAPMLSALRLHLDGYTSMYEMRFRLRTGTNGWRTVLSRGRVVERGQRGEATRMVGTMVDLTGHARAPGYRLAAAAGADGQGRVPLHALIGGAASPGAATGDAERAALPVDAHVLESIDDLLGMALTDGSP